MDAGSPVALMRTRAAFAVNFRRIAAMSRQHFRFARAAFEQAVSQQPAGHAEAHLSLSSCRHP
jgi:hypothetical protein